jgi:hypothetical protein
MCRNIEEEEDDEENENILDKVPPAINGSGVEL